jgi:hypothetical protein
MYHAFCCHFSGASLNVPFYHQSSTLTNLPDHLKNNRLKISFFITVCQIFDASVHRARPVHLVVVGVVESSCEKPGVVGVGGGAEVGRVS